MKFFSKIQLDLTQREARECLLELDTPYREHQLLWHLFPHSASRNFLFVRVSGGIPDYYVVSGERPLSPSPAWKVDTREYRPQISAGDQLAFRLRANPVVIQKVARTPEQHQAWLENRRSKKLPDKGADPVFRRRIRHDVVMQAKRDMDWQRLPEDLRPPLAELIHKAGAEWLEGKGERNGFRPHRDSLQVDGYNKQRFMRKGQDPVVFSSLEFQGELTVTDPAVFVEKALFAGIGPAKAFGCGLMLVRRVRCV